jgi:glycosyltransferase involved in cell wall biosynthesis
MKQNSPLHKLPEVSVIVPVYNVESYIIPCLESIVRQTYRDFELLLIDDRGQDQSIQIAIDFLDNHPEISYRLLTHTSNSGLSAARNTGIEGARGRFLIFVDSDDWMPDNALADFYQTVQQYPNSIVCGNSIAVTEGVYAPYWTSVKEKKIFEKSDAIRRMLVYDELLDTAWSKIYPRRLFVDYDIRFPVGLYFEDTPTNVRLFNHAENIIAIPAQVYFYRRNRPGSILQQKSLKSVNDRLQVFSNIYDYISNHTDVDKEFALNYYLECLVNEYRGTFTRYKLSLKDQYAVTNKIDSMIRRLKKQQRRNNFRHEIGIKFNLLVNNAANQHKLMFYLLHNKKYSIISKLIDTYIQKKEVAVT